MSDKKQNAPVDVKKAPTEEEVPEEEKPEIKSDVMDQIRERLGDFILDSSVQREKRLFITTHGDAILEVARGLYDIGFAHLSAISGVEYDDRFESVYILWSYELNVIVIVKALLSKDYPVIHSVTPFWRSANWHERETYDLMGISYAGHPDLRRILNPDDFQGHPLRKDFKLTAAPWIPGTKDTEEEAVEE